MPAIVDHDERRLEVVEVAARLVASQGPDAATVRAVAEAAGYSTKVVSHYFADKRDMLLMTYRYAAEHSSDIAEATQPKSRGDAAAYVLALLPIEASLRRDWLVWFAFWGLAIADAEFAAEQQARVKRARDRIAEILAQDHRFAGLSSAARKRGARDLLTLVMGMALQASFDPQDWPPSRQRQAIHAQLNLLSAG